jgi:Arc/MetJ-type ribon-helix-helix transcriptional regulator
MHDDQVTLRIPRELARQLRQQARERGVPSSQIVREALQSYLGGTMPEDPNTTWARLQPLIGSLPIDSAAVERDALASQMRRHNWRE